MIMRVPWVACLFVLTLMSLLGCRGRTSSLQGQQVPDKRWAAATQRGAPRARAGLLAAVEGTLEQIYAQVNPSVVNIRTVQRQTVVFPVVPEMRQAIPSPRDHKSLSGKGQGRALSGTHWDTLSPIIMWWRGPTALP